MTDQTLRGILLAGLVATAVAAMGGAPFGIETALGILAGGLWNVANVWCLARALGVWLSPKLAPRRHQVGWFIVKFPLLYAVLFGLVQLPGISLMGFGIGFLIVIMAAVFVSVRALKPVHRSVSSHGG
ncbi:MAG: ATP synthase subunit I [Candidatus Omnitrophota bacterium]|nr:ATP synthase subunit I [Candidatus Omnitrophota bacterium]